MKLDSSEALCSSQSVKLSSTLYFPAEKTPISSHFSMVNIDVCNGRNGPGVPGRVPIYLPTYLPGAASRPRNLPTYLLQLLV